MSEYRAFNISDRRSTERAMRCLALAIEDLGLDPALVDALAERFARRMLEDGLRLVRAAQPVPDP